LTSALMVDSSTPGSDLDTLKCFTDAALVGSSTLGSDSDMLMASLDTLIFALDTNAGHQRKTFFEKMRQKGGSIASI